MRSIFCFCQITLNVRLACCICFAVIHITNEDQSTQSFVPVNYNNFQYEIGLLLLFCCDLHNN